MKRQFCKKLLDIAIITSIETIERDLNSPLIKSNAPSLLQKGSFQLVCNFLQIQTGGDRVPHLRLEAGPLAQAPALPRLCKPPVRSMEP